MKRDEVLLKKILKEIEDKGPNIDSKNFRIEGYDSNTVSGHLELLYNEGLINGSYFSHTGGWGLLGMNLTMSGHDTLDELLGNKKEGSIRQKKQSEVIESEAASDLDIIRKLEQVIGQKLMVLSDYKQIVTEGNENNGYMRGGRENVVALRIVEMHLSDISFISGLKALVHLNLSGNDISDISPLKNLGGLKKIKLSRNRITVIPSLNDLVKLNELNLSSNQIADISPLLGHEKLDRLNLIDNNISKLPVGILDFLLPIKLADDNLNGIFLKGNPLKEPPIEIVKKGNKAIKEYFRSRDSRKDSKSVPGKKKNGKDEQYKTEQQMDNPAKEDRLGREIIAEDLAKSLRSIREKMQSAKHSFLVNVQGAWGIGKTSFLEFLKKCLETIPDKNGQLWIVIEFGAWKHHRLGAPWWSIMNELYKQAKKKIGKFHSYKLRYKESVWRYGKTILFLLILILVCLISKHFQTFLSSIPDITKYLISVFTLLGMVWTSLKYFLKWPLLNSSNSIQSFIDQSRNPKDIIAKHFNELIKWIRKPVIIFIDDLDRCPESYVVELLEEIQTLYGNTDVMYVVAADRRWICASYEKIYDSFKDFVNEPGRPIGRLFLEKIFQLSFTLTHDSEKINQYWQSLVMNGDRSLAVDTKNKEELDILEQKIVNSKSNKEVLQIIDVVEKKKGAPDFNIRKKAINRLSDFELKAENEHGLMNFSSLLGTNPRLMKRMINTFNILRTIALSSGFKTAYLDKHLALWTIIELRWPELADYLANHPESVKLIGSDINENQKDILDELKELFKSEEVKDVFRGKGIGVTLDENAIKQFAKLRV